MAGSPLAEPHPEHVFTGQSPGPEGSDVPTVPNCRRTPMLRSSVIGRALRIRPTHDGPVNVRTSPVVVELDVSDLGRSVEFYVSALGFTTAVHRPERRFAYLTRDSCVDLMLQWADGPGERLRTASLERPFGRGVSLVIPCRDVDAVFSEFTATGGQAITPIEERHYDIDVLHPTARWSDVGSRRVITRQFVIADPDGYLLRFYTERAP
jgi:catechol 2,3-dioxygenase-like lactoylglutathione lyase family enzyme